MKISLKKKHIIFAASPLRNANSLSDYYIVKQLKDAFEAYFTTYIDENGLEVSGQEDEIIELVISSDRFMELYAAISGMPEGMTASFSTEIMGYLQPQVKAGIDALDPDWLKVAAAIEREKQQHAQTFRNHTEANLEFLRNLKFDYEL